MIAGQKHRPETRRKISLAMRARAGNTAASFWSRVDRSDLNGCWPWTASRDADGYGRVRYNGKQIKTHQLAHILSGGILRPGLVVRHNCDNPPCCNPNHLKLGTRKQNSEDMVVRGRSAKGERHGMSRASRIRRGECL